jgi:hypothetical protein
VWGEGVRAVMFLFEGWAALGMARSVCLDGNSPRYWEPIIGLKGWCGTGSLPKTIKHGRAGLPGHWILHPIRPSRIR